MKLFSVITTSFSLLAAIANAQTTSTASASGNTGPYVRIGAGYNFPHAGQTTIMTNFPFNATISGSGSSSTVTTKRGSFGSGFAVSLAGGYMVSRHIGIELGVDAIAGPKKYKTTNTYTSSGPSSVQVDNYKTNAKIPIYIIPSIVLTTGGEGLNLYTRLGVAVPVTNKLTLKDEAQYTSPTTIDQTNYEYTLTTRFSIGMKGAIGVSFPITDAILGWFEVNGMSRNAYLKKRELVVYTENGVDMLGSQTTNQKVVEYEFEDSSTGTTIPSQPQKDITSTVPFSNIGAMVGVKLDF